jgi:DNA invertase Pin-like site-specific DNA recombinase
MESQKKPVHHRKLSPAMIRKVHLLLEQGVPKLQIAKRLGISRMTIYRLLEMYPALRDADHSKN